MLNQKNLVAAVLASLATVFASSALAQETQWQKDHPRRDEVNGRLDNQNARIKTEVKDGQISKGHAAQLHAEDHSIRQEERGMAAQNGGHITKGQQKSLNQQENAVSQQIGK